MTKRFGPVAALDKVDIALYPGEIHAVLGENGAGKSTLVGILSGNLTPDDGDLSLGERKLSFRSARDARKFGVDIVQQHFMLVPAFTVAENLALFALGDSSRVVEHAREIADRLGWNLDLRARAADLSVGALQRVEIVKALMSDGRILLLDEPTATLTPNETEDLFRVMRRLREEGKAIVLITHKLQEALSVGDRVTVLRRGKVVVSMPAQGVSPGQLAVWMVGDTPPELNKPLRSAGSTVVNVAGLSIFGERGETVVDNVSFSLSAGEIVGFGGVSGNGQVELAEALAGVRGSIADDVAYIPEDRQRDGLALPMSISDNLLASARNRKEVSFVGVLVPFKVRSWCERVVAKFGIKTDSIDAPASSLSGGNQQKVVVARALDSEPEIIVAVNPTRGLDIVAENYVHSQLLEAKRRGAAIALFSTDLEELALLADRTFIMSGGRLLQGDNAAELMGGLE
ncbi:MAG: ATP-binding cassette domain-containing protein [Fimbriimonadales bacterium]